MPGWLGIAKYRRASLKRVDWQMSKQEGTPKGPASSSWSPGEIVFYKFEVIELIGSGARGKIFKVNQIDLQRVAALKVLQTNAPSSKAILRFQNEARAVSRLSHPNIAKVLDFGIKNNQLFMAMEFVNGINLEDLLLRHKTLSVERVLHIFSQVSDALAHAHAKGIIHRDIKPSNIMIEDASSDASPIKVLDFGLAKIIGDEPNEGYLTDPDALIGSPLYMSPDQALGKGPSPQSDLYSVGCVMFHCLTGRPPFMGSTPLETLAKHRDEQAPNLGKLLSDTEPSQMVAHVVNKLLRKNPENRFQSSKELMIELKFLLGVSIEDPDDKKALATKYGLNEPESSSSIAEAAEKKPPCEIKMTPGKASLWKELRVPIAIVSFICAASGLSILYFINRP